MGSSRLTSALAVCALLATPGARAAGGTSGRIDGEYDTPLGRVRLGAAGEGFVGTLAAPAPGCALPQGARVLEATLLDDSLAGRLRVCGRGCPEEAWSTTVLLVGKDRLSGAAHVAKGCEARLGKSGGVTFARVKPGSGTAAEPASPRRGGAAEARERARALLRDGAAYLQEGYFERARARFHEAIRADRGVPEAYNGVGVTYRARNDLRSALEWYKRALAVDPDFGDAYYNMACVYALRGEKDLALRYLQIAALNGYQSAEGMDADPDLEPLRAEAAYRALVRQRL